MAILGVMAEVPFSPTEMEMFDNLRMEGRKFKFTSKDGREDVINGIFQLKWAKPTNVPIPIFGFEEFRVSESSHVNTHAVAVRFEKISGQFSKLEFRPDRKARGIAICPDTRINRRKLADLFFEKRIIIESLLTADGEVAGAKISKDIQELALKQRADRVAKKNEKDPNIADRYLSGMTAEQKEMLLKKLIAEENAKRTPIAVPTAKKEEAIEEIKQEVVNGLQEEKAKEVVPVKAKREPWLKTRARLMNQIFEDIPFINELEAKYGTNKTKIRLSPEFEERFRADAQKYRESVK